MLKAVQQLARQPRARHTECTIVHEYGETQRITTTIVELGKAYASSH